MKILNKEEKVGLLVILALISVGYLTIKAGDLSFGKGRGLVLYAGFANVRGLDKGAQVRLAGVEAGKVEMVALDNGVPKLTIIIFPNIKVRKNSLASIKSQGFMGEKYVEISPGTSDAPYLEGGDFIQVSEEDGSLDQLAQQASVLAEDLKKITGALTETIASPDGKMAIRQSLGNIQEITTLFKELLQQNNQHIQATVINFQQLSGALNQVVKENKAQISQIISDLQKLAETLRQRAPVVADQIETLTKSMTEILTENRDVLHQGMLNINHLVLKLQGTTDNVDRILTTVNEGKGTIGKLVQDDTLYKEAQDTVGGLKKMLVKADAFRLYLGYRNEYATRFDKSKSYVSLKLQPSQDKYYLLELVDDFRGITTTTETETIIDSNRPIIKREESTEDGFKFNLQVAKRFQYLTLRGGLIESKGGVGFDYALLDDNLQLHLDASDFGASKPHLKLYAHYKIGKYFSLSSGFDHLMEDDRSTYFLGAGFSFEDEDLKYLLGKVPIPGF